MPRKIYTKEFNEILRSIPEISWKEREYLLKAFRSELADGLGEFELRQKIQRLKNDQSDIISSLDAEKVKNKVLERLKNF